MPEIRRNLARLQKLMTNQPITYIDHLDDVTAEDAAALRRAQTAYGDSWKKRGGVSAFMMCARKWDRLEKAMTDEVILRRADDSADMVVSDYDIFNRIAADPRPEGIIDDIRDLRRYLVLIEAEMIARGEGRDEVRSEG